MLRCRGRKKNKIETELEFFEVGRSEFAGSEAVPFIDDVIAKLTENAV